MTMLVVQLWLLLLAAFVAGSVVAYVVVRAVTPPLEELLPTARRAEDER